MKKRETNESLLVVDIGNTSTAFGFFKDGRVGGMDRLPTDINNRRQIIDRLVACFERRRIGGVGLCSVVPAAAIIWQSALEKLYPTTPVLNIGPDIPLGVGIDYPRPDTIGPDRLANAAGALDRYGAPVIVIDFGTAVTFDVVSAKGAYVGGVIAPGLPLMLDYLAERTALLPRIELGAICHGVGRSTVEAMRMGALWGYPGMIRAILTHVRRYLGARSVKVCATGGHARRVLANAGLRIPYNLDLTLYGVGRICERNFR